MTNVAREGFKEEQPSELDLKNELQIQLRQKGQPGQGKSPEQKPRGFKYWTMVGSPDMLGLEYGRTQASRLGPRNVPCPLRVVSDRVNGRQADLRGSTKFGVRQTWLHHLENV